ncbi:unnamed protein product [Macrosiphum euphorbiae]|uniref:Uncharacterized protein n=1 Tax=Macrosiphum euphorbiae TaxID=13131 RepID=A0AAV0WYE6_9HEMI|nr:unnamed protein product [Macrosiphum euphorbiae]
MFDTYEERADNKSGHKMYRKIRKRKRELTVDEKREGEINFEIRYSLRINTYYAIIDKLHSELERRNLYYDEANKKFNFLFQIIKLSPLEAYKKTQILQNIYKNDFSSLFANECIQFRSYLMSITENIRPKTIVDIFIRTKNLPELFPYVYLYSIKDVFMLVKVQLFSREIIFSIKVKSY